MDVCQPHLTLDLWKNACSYADVAMDEIDDKAKLYDPIRPGGHTLMISVMIAYTS